MNAFECRMCGECCYGEGGIRVDEAESRAAARFLGIALEAFLSGYCETRNGLTYIRAGVDHYCIFFDPEKQCRIHPVKPAICSLWPFFPANVSDPDTWRMAMEACPGINPDGTFDAFVREAGEVVRRLEESRVHED